LSKNLVRDFKFRSLGFPLVGQHFGLSEELRHKMLGHHDMFTKNMAFRSAEQSIDPKPFLKAIALLSRSQLVKYFKYDGLLMEDMELVDVVEKFPTEAQPDLIQILLHSSD
jgi:hypothetical protein